MSEAVVDDKAWDAFLDQHVPDVAPTPVAAPAPGAVDPRPLPLMQHGGDLNDPDPSPSGALYATDRPNLVSIGGLDPGGASAIDIGRPTKEHRADDPASQGAIAWDKTNRNFREFAGGMAGGALAGGAASALPGVSNLLGAAGTAPKLLGAALAGGAAGAGADVAGRLAAGEPLPTGKQIATSATVGGALGVIGKAVGEAFKGAPAKEDANMIAKAGENMRAGTYERFFGSRDGALRTLKGDPELYKSLGDPEKTLAITAQRTAADNAAAKQIMSDADADVGQVPTLKWRKIFDSAMKDVAKVGGTESNPTYDATFGFAKQFASGPGKDLKTPPSTEEVRSFLSNVVGKAINPRPQTRVDTATNEAAAKLYGKFMDAIDQHVASSDPDLAKQLATLNERRSTYIMIEDAAQNKLRSESLPGEKSASKIERAIHWAKHGVGGGLGGTIGGVIGGPQGAAVGSVAGTVLGPKIIDAAGGAIDALGEGVTGAMASKAGQVVGKAVGPATTAVTGFAGPKAANVVFPDTATLQGKPGAGKRVDMPTERKHTPQVQNFIDTWKEMGGPGLPPGPVMKKFKLLPEDFQ